MTQGAGFPTGIPRDLYTFHRYTPNSAPLYHSLVQQSWSASPSLARRFHNQLVGPPTCALRPVTPDNACLLRFTAAAGT